METRKAFAPTPVGCAELAGLDPDERNRARRGPARPRPTAATRDEVTLYKAMGHVAEDIAAAELVYAAACREAAGVLVEL